MALGISARGATLKYGGEPKPTRYTIKPKLRLKLNFETYFGESRGVWNSFILSFLSLGEIEK